MDIDSDQIYIPGRLEEQSKLKVEIKRAERSIMRISDRKRKIFREKKLDYLRDKQRSLIQIHRDHLEALPRLRWLEEMEANGILTAAKPLVYRKWITMWIDKGGRINYYYPYDFHNAGFYVCNKDIEWPGPLYGANSFKLIFPEGKKCINEESSNLGHCVFYFFDGIRINPANGVVGVYKNTEPLSKFKAKVLRWI